MEAHTEKSGLTLGDFEFERRKLRGNRTIILNGDVDAGMAHEFIEDIKVATLDNTKPIHLVLNSPGGNVFNGIAIITAIKEAQKMGVRILGEVHGHACSMAFFILQCCDERYMGRLDILMAHGVTTGFSGDIKNLEAETKLLSHWHTEFAELIALRCAKDTQYAESGYWFEVLRDNTPQWYTADESIEMGLVDAVYDDKN